MLPLDKIRAEGFNAGIEAAAKIADPKAIRTGKKPGRWRQIRQTVAAQIRACQVDLGGA